MRDAGIAIRGSSGSFAVVEVRGVEPDAGEDVARRLRGALAEAGVLVLRQARPLEDAELQAIVRLFGPIKDPVGRTKDGEPFRYAERRQVIDSGFVLTEALREELGALELGGLDDRRPGLFETFHVDDTYTRAPAAATVLHARRLPPSGGGPTLFLDMRDAWKRLDDATRARVLGRRVVYAHNNEDAFPPRRAARGPADVLEEVEHPLVRRHPGIDSVALFLDLDRALRLADGPEEEGRALLQALQDHAERNASRCGHAWCDHDVLVWDNASVQHRAGGDFPVGEPRRFWRYMVAGEAPMAATG